MLHQEKEVPNDSGRLLSWDIFTDKKAVFVLFVCLFSFFAVFFFFFAFSVYILIFTYQYSKSAFLQMATHFELV